MLMLRWEEGNERETWRRWRIVVRIPFSGPEFFGFIFYCERCRGGADVVVRVVRLIRLWGCQ